MQWEVCKTPLWVPVENGFPGDDTGFLESSEEAAEGLQARHGEGFDEKALEMNRRD